MKIERTKNASRNMFFGIIQKIYTIVVPFLMRTAMIYFMGVQYLGLNSLFATILSVLNLAELGVGSAMVFSMYKPIAEDDSEKICALMRLYKIYYRVIGLVIAVLGIALIPFLPYLIKSDVPQGINIYILYFLNLGTTVFTYWLFAYKNCLLSAHQRNDVGTKIGMIISTFTYILQFLCLWLLRDYYIYLIIAFATGILSNIVTAIVTTKMYPDYKAKGELPKEERKQINKRVRDLFTAKLGGTIVNSVDTIVISAFLGLSTLAIYQNYYFIMNSVMGFVMIIFTSCTAGIGNSLVTETEEKNYFDFKKLAFLIIWIATVCISCFICLYQPFMKIWVGEKYLLGMDIVVLLCVYFYLYLVNNLSCVYKDAGGIWHEDRFRPLIGGLANLVMNLMMVQYIGIYGILLSTIISYIMVAMPWVIHNVFKLVFKRSPKEYVLMILKGALVSTVIASLCYVICQLVPLQGILQLIVNGAICLVVSNTALIIIYRHNKMYIPFLDLLDRVTKNKFHFIIKKLK